MTAAFAPQPHFVDRAAFDAPVAVRPVSPEVYRRRRLAVVAVVVGLVLGIASFGRSADATSTPEADAAAAVLVVVQPGDTLWSIAETLAPGTDPRPMVAALREIAGPGSLQPGQLLTVPGSLVD
ncbi:MAG: LysM domain-containing protein [Acidimicrobiales bacterium]|nr:LysM domain-containing protein [Acidimicrobiales bacterium]